MGCYYCDEHHEGREAIMYKVGEMEAGVLYLFKDQAHKGRCALALQTHRQELCECGPEELAAPRPFRSLIRGRLRARCCLFLQDSGAGAALRGRISRDDRRPAGKAGDVSLPALTGLLADPSCLLNTFPLFCAAAL